VAGTAMRVAGAGMALSGSSLGLLLLFRRRKERQDRLVTLLPLVVLVLTVFAGCSKSSTTPGAKKTPLAAGLFVACLCGGVVLILVRYYEVSDGLLPLPNPRFIRINPLACLLPSRGHVVASLACYISNTHASRCQGGSDVTCCIWDVVQV
jgi:hypothetical protein